MNLFCWRWVLRDKEHIVFNIKYNYYYLCISSHIYYVKLRRSLKIYDLISQKWYVHVDMYVNDMEQNFVQFILIIITKTDPFMKMYQNHYLKFMHLHWKSLTIFLCLYIEKYWKTQTKKSRHMWYWAFKKHE